MTKVAYLIHSAAPSGAELALLRALHVWPEDIPVELFIGSDGPLVEEYRATGTTVHVDPIPGMSARRGAGLFATLGAVFGLLRYALSLRRKLRAVRPDVVVAGSLRAVVYGRLASFGIGSRFVWSVHDRLSREYLGKAAAIYAKVLPRVVDGIIVNSRSTLEPISAGGVPVLICPPGANLRRVERPAPRSMRHIAVVGRISPWKGQDKAIEAFARASLDAECRLHLIGGALFGENDFESQLHDLARDRGVADRVVFHGHISNPSEVIETMDVLAHTSVLPEPFGSVVIEGMDNGCIVIATSPGGTTEVIDDGVNGYLVPANDVGALSDAFRAVQQLSVQERDELIRAGHATVERFGIEKTTPARAGFIASVALGNARPGVASWDNWEGVAV